LWLYFDGKPHKTKIFVDNILNNVNGITGKEEHMHERNEQDYMGTFNVLFLAHYVVCPPDYWFSGIPLPGGQEIQQIIAPTFSPNAMFYQNQTKPPMLRIQVTPMVMLPLKIKKLIFSSWKQISSFYVLIMVRKLKT
jgi:hypothetical protein